MVEKGRTWGALCLEAVGMGNSLGRAFPPRSVPGKLVAPSWNLEASIPPTAVSPAATSAQRHKRGLALPTPGGVAPEAVEVTRFHHFPSSWD